MANRKEFYYRQKVTDVELDAAFDDMEAADQALAADHGLDGVVADFGVTQAAVPNLTVRVSDGTAYTKEGKRIRLGATQILNCAVDEDGASTAVINIGQSRILSVFAAPARAGSDPRTDGTGAPVNFVQSESWALHVVRGAESASPAPPLPRADEVLLADITLVFGQSAILDADISDTRKEWVFKTASGLPITVGTVREAVQRLADESVSLTDLAVDVGPDDGVSLLGADAVAGSPVALAQGTAKTQLGELLAAHNAHLNDAVDAHAASAIGYGGGGAWADGVTNPATTVEAQLDKVVTDLSATDNGACGASKVGVDTLAQWADLTNNAGTTLRLRLHNMILDLAGSGGTAKLGGAAKAGAPNSLSAGTLKAQLEELLGFINTLPSWTAMTLNGIWTPVGCAYRLESAGKRVFLQGSLSANIGGAGDWSFWNVPVGYRPLSESFLQAIAYDAVAMKYKNAVLKLQLGGTPNLQLWTVDGADPLNQVYDVHLVGVNWSLD